MAIRGSYAYLLRVNPEGLGVVSLLDISQPSSPRVRSWSPEFSRPFIGGSHLALDGDYLLVSCACQFGGLTVFDVSDPANPVGVGSYRPPGAERFPAVAPAIGSGGYIYARILSGTDSLAILRRAEGQFQLQEVAVVRDLEGLGTVSGAARQRCTVLAADGNRLYCGGAILDISDPVSPRYMGSLTISGWVSDIALAGGYAYVSEGPLFDGRTHVGGGLRVFDVSDPTSPVEVAFDRRGMDAGYGENVIVDGSLAYVGDRRGNRTTIFDVSQPAVPTRVATLPGAVVGVSNRWAYVAEGAGPASRRIRFWDVSDPSTPTELGGMEAGRGEFIGARAG